jgi:N-acylneuraminate cytidylyltransferase
MIPPITGLIFMKHHSARVPGKNLRPLCGKPLCHWIFFALEASPYIVQIIVNTDSEAIADEVSRFPKVTVHRRPQHLLGDHVVANRIIEWDLAHSDGEFYLQSHSTNPLLTTATINRSIEAFCGQSQYDSLFTVTEYQRRFYWADGRGINHDPACLLPTQQLPPIFEENSCVYLFSKASFRSSGQRLGRCPMMFPIHPLEAVDIDTLTDFQVAEALMGMKLRGCDRHQPPPGA